MPSLDMPWFFVGTLIAACTIAGWVLVTRNVKNPYGEPLYWVKFPQFLNWWESSHPNEPLKFLNGTMVRIVQTTPMEQSLENGAKIMWTQVLVVEPNDGRQLELPRGCLGRGSNFDAWKYAKWHQFSVGSDAKRSA